MKTLYVSLLSLALALNLFAQEAKEASDIIYPAADDPVSQVISPATTTAPDGGIFTGIFYALFLAALGTVLWYFWKRRSDPTSCCRKMPQGIEIGATKSLGNRQFLVVAKYRNKELLLGVGPGFINKLEALEKDEGEDVCSEQPSA